MTGEEMERAIEFILQRQATFEERLEQTQGQIAETNRVVQMMAVSQSQFNETVMTIINALAEKHQKLAESHQKLAESQRTLVESHQKLAEAHERLSEAHERLADSLQHTDQKLDALIDIVRERMEGKEGG